MILADKIVELRKRSGWSQEELAGRLGVSRQAVSKWESAASIPDLDKIMKLSELFEVSTDELLKDSVALSGGAEPPEEERAGGRIHAVSLEEANAYLAAVRHAAGKIALGAALCILSPVGVLCLAGLSEGPGSVPENATVWAGVPFLLLLVGCAVALFLFYGRGLEAWDYLEREEIELAYGVTGVVQKRKAEYESAHTFSVIAGVVLCILSAIPILAAAAFDSERLILFAVSGCLLLVAAGVFLLVRTGTLYGGFQRLLEQGDFTRERKLENRRNEHLSRVYWCVVTALYLGWSFVTMDWGRTWIVWPCAGVLFGAICAVAAIVRKK